MITGDAKSQPALGFLTILEHEGHGFVGGYLILNMVGRPLEFHCTAPLKPNRAQQILFGPTLESYLYGEQIGQTLLAKCSLELLAVCTDVERALCVRDHVSLPVALVISDQQEPSPSILPSPAMDSGELSQARQGPGVRVDAWRVDAAHRVGPHLHQFAVGRNRLAVPLHRESDQHSIAERLANLATFDLAEPFSRIREAVEEAHKVARAY